MSEKMVKCKACQAEIAASAAACPKCGAKNKKKGMGCFGGAILCIAIIWIVSDAVKGWNNADGGTPTQVKSAGNEASQPAKEVEIKVGDTITTPKFEIKVLSVNKMRRIVANEFSESVAADGGTYIAIQWEYKNISKKPINMTWSKPSVGIIDPDGAKYSADLGATMTYATIAEPTTKVVSNLNPGIKIKDADVFEVAEENLAKPGWKIAIEADRNVIFPLSFQ